MRKVLAILALLSVSACTATSPAYAGTMVTSFYGGGERLNRHTASGEVFRSHGMTAAHRTLRFGTKLKVMHRGRSVVVRINDRGPAKWTRRDLDISYGAAKRLGMLKVGVTRVRVARL